MPVFTHQELVYVGGEHHLARITPLGPDLTPHAVPVRWT